MSSIVILAPFEELSIVAKEACGILGESVPVIKVGLHNAVEKAKVAERQGAEVLISRGTVAWKLIESDIKVPIVQIPITGYDLTRSYVRAKKFGEKIGIADTPEVLQGVESIESIFDCHIEKYPIYSMDEVDQGVQAIVQKGIDVLIGKSIYVQKITNPEVKTVVLSSGTESMIQAINEAKSLINVSKTEIARRKQLQAILDFIADGVIAVDENGSVTVCNPAVEKILKIPQEQMVGRNIDDILKNSRIKHVLNSGREELNRIQDENGVKVITNRIPIKHEDKVFGAVITYQELRKFQQQEQEIRKKLSRRGHVTKYTLSDVVGESHSFKKAIEKAKKYAKVESTVLLTGETGVGKEVFAHLIHSHSLRSDGPFVAVNCAAIPENLLESELFGYVEGAFTGAKKGGKTGLFELAHKGTIFLDEIGELAESLQARLLRVLQEGEVMRLGDERVIPIDVRVIAASNRDFENMVDEGSFRADLYYRLNILDITIPSLKERVDDIPLLCESFIVQLKENINKDIIGFDVDAMRLLQNYHWPGNIRQLRNVVERAMILAPEKVIDAETVMIAGGKAFKTTSYKDVSMDDTRLEKDTSNGKLHDFERDYIIHVLKQVNGNKTEAAKILGIGRTTLWRKLNEK